MQIGFSYNGIIADAEKGLALLIDAPDPSSVIRDLRAGMFVRVMGGTIHPYPGIRRNLGEIYPHNKSENDLFQQINWQIISIEADRIYLDYPVIPPGWEDSPNLNQLSHFGVLIDSRGSVIAQDCPWDIKDLTGADQFKWTDRKDRPDSCVNRPLPAGTEQKPKNKNLIKTLAIVAALGAVFYVLYRIWK